MSSIQHQHICRTQVDRFILSIILRLAFFSHRIKTVTHNTETSFRIDILQYCDGSTPIYSIGQRHQRTVAFTIASISPELIPADEQGNIKQKTEDLVGPYELHDFFLYHFLRFGSRPAKIFFLAQKAFDGVYDDETIKKWLKNFCRRFFIQQFKRSCLPDGPKVGSVSLSPRGDWRMPSDASAALWIKECEEL